MPRPYVVCHNVASVDGRLTVAPGVLLLFGDERWQAVAGDSSGVYLRLMDAHGAQAFLEGSGSFTLEGADLAPLPAATVDAYDDYLPAAVASAPGRRWLAVVDGRGRGRGWMKEYPGEEWAGWHLLILACRATPSAYLAYLREEGIPYLVAGEERVDLAAALEKMRDLLGVERLVSTGGGRLNGALLRAGLVDEVEVEFFPAIIGGLHTPSLFDAPDLAPGEWPTRLRLLAVAGAEEGHVRLRYEVVREE